MMSENSNEATIFPMAMTKSKRDEFIVEIRKSKNRTILQQKRMKLYGFFEEGQTLLPMQVEGAYGTMMPINQPPPPIELSLEMQETLTTAHTKFYEALRGQSWDEALTIIRWLRELIGDQPNGLPGRVVIEMKIVPDLLVLLSEQFSKLPVLQVEVAWLLANISAGSTEDCTYLVEQGIIPILCECLKSSINDDLQENAMWTLANISGDANLAYREIILDAGALNQVVRELCKTPKKFVYYRTAAWLISNLVRGRPFPPFEKVEKAFGALTHLFGYNDVGIQQHTLLSLAYLTEEGKETHIKSISENGLITKVVNYISDKDEKVAINALKVIGNLALANRKIASNLYEHDIFKGMPAILESPNAVLRKEGCLALSNIFSNNDFDDHDYVIDFELIPKLINIAGRDEEENRAIAIQCLFRFMHNCSSEEAQVPIEKGMIDVLIENMQYNNPKIIENCLQALYKILEHGENMRKENNGDNNVYVLRILQNNELPIIENLLNYKDENIYTKASVLWERFFKFN